MSQLEPLPLLRDDSGPFAGLCTLVLEQPGKPVVVLDHDLIRRLEATLKIVPREALGLVLASASERVFVAGADLKAIQELSDDQLHRYLEYGSRVFGMLGQLPFPTAAAINGAALGGGLELAMHCDALVACPSASGKPYPIGLPEAGLSICPGWGGTNLLPARIDPANAIAQTAAGKPMNFDEAKAAGLFDALAPSAADLRAAAKSWILEQRRKPMPRRDGTPPRWIGRGKPADVLHALDRIKTDLPDTDAARAVADAVDQGLTQGWQAALAAERAHLVRLRSTPGGKAAIAAFFAKK